MTGIFLKRSLGLAVLLLLPLLEPSAHAEDTDFAPGQQVEQAGPNLYRLYGRGVLRVPPGWVLIKKEGNNLIFEKTTTPPYADNCVVSPGVFHNSNGDRKADDSMADFLVQDYVDDFNKKSAHKADISTRRWSIPYRGMTASRFFGSARLKNLLARSDGVKVDGYVSTSVIEIAKAGVAIAVRCNGFYRTIDENVGSDMLNGIDIDASRPRIFR